MRRAYPAAVPRAPIMLAALCAALLACAGCGSGDSSDGAAPAEAPAPPPLVTLADDATAAPEPVPDVEWDEPFLGAEGTPVPSAEGAREVLEAATGPRFTPAFPARAARLAVDSAGPAATLLVQVDTPEGPVRLTEYSWYGPAADQFGDDPATTTYPATLFEACPWCTGRRTLLLAGGQLAAIARDEPNARLHVVWLQDAETGVDLLAPASVSDETALAVANEVSAQRAR